MITFSIRLLLLNGFILCSCILFAQDKPEYAVSNISPELIKNAEAVVRLEQTKYYIESPRKYIHSHTRAVTIFDEDSYESFVYVFYDQYSKADFNSIILYDASGNFLRKIKNSEILDAAAYQDISILQDNRMLLARPLAGQLPYTVEYHWTSTHSETMFYPDWQPVDTEESIELAKFILDTPEDQIVHIKTLNADFKYSDQKQNDRRIQTWTIDNLPAIQEEESGPPDHELLPAVLLSPATFQINEYTGSMTDWKSFGAFLYEINKDREKMTPEMVTLIRQITQNANTDLEKIDTLYKWMQKNMRYVSVQLGIGGWQSFDAAYVAKNRYGDCKALSTFMKGMLQEVGIGSHQVIIKWDKEDNLFLDEFMHNDFNHMMLYIPGEKMWLECTSNHLPTGMIDIDEENKKVLLITPEGGVIARTPSTPASSNQIVTVDTIHLSEQILIKGKRLYMGNRQRQLRGMHHYVSNKDQREEFLEHLPLSVSKLDFFQIVPDALGSETLLKYQAVLEQFGLESGNRYFIPVNELYGLSDHCSDPDKRKTDFIYKDDYTQNNHVYITIPSGYEVEYLPTDIHHSFEDNEFSLTVALAYPYIIIRHKIIHAPIRLAPARYNDYCEFRNSIAKANNQKIILKRSKT